MKTLITLAISFGLLFSTSAFAKEVIYVAAGSANKVLVIDPQTNKVVAEYTNIDNPHSLVTTPDGEYVISGSLKETKGAEGKPAVGTIYLIHPAHGHVMSIWSTEGMVHHQTITPDGNFVISTHPTQGNISYLDLTGGGGIKTVKTGNGPNYAAITNDGTKAFVSNSGSNTISEIDIKTWVVTRSFEGGPGPEHMVLSKDQSSLFVINARAGKFSEVNIASGKVVREWPLGKGAHGLDLSEDGKTIFATAKGKEVLVAIDLDNNTRREMNLTPAPYHLEVLPGTGKVYVSSRKAPKIFVIDPKAWKVEAEISIQGEGHQMAVGSD